MFQIDLFIFQFKTHLLTLQICFRVQNRMSSDEVVPANAVLFADLCDVLENIALQRKRKNRQEQERVLTNFVNNFRIKVANITVKKVNSTFIAHRKVFYQQVY